MDELDRRGDITHLLDAPERAGASDIAYTSTGECLIRPTYTGGELSSIRYRNVVHGAWEVRCAGPLPLYDGRVSTTQRCRNLIVIDLGAHERRYAMGRLVEAGWHKGAYSQWYCPECDGTINMLASQQVRKQKKERRG